jgi:hypothetical protein
MKGIRREKDPPQGHVVAVVQDDIAASPTVIA